MASRSSARSARNVAQADASVKSGKWERSKYVGVSIVGKTLAVMGFGKVRKKEACRCMRPFVLVG